MKIFISVSHVRGSPEALLAAKNKFGYTTIQYAVIKLWGGVLYLDYQLLPSGLGDQKQFATEVKSYLKSCSENDEDAIVEFEEWCQEGAPIRGKPILTKSVLDSILHSSEFKLSREITVYKYGDKVDHANRWISVTTVKDKYNHLGPEERYVLPVGTKVIFADGIADDNEVIIHTSELPN